MSTDMNDYREQYRCASTLGLVSELKGDGTSFDVKRMLRFHTISDGNAAIKKLKSLLKILALKMVCLML